MTFIHSYVDPSAFQCTTPEIQHIGDEFCGIRGIDKKDAVGVFDISSCRLPQILVHVSQRLNASEQFDPDFRCTYAVQPPKEAPVTIFAIIVCWFYGLNYVRGMPDRVGHDNRKVGHPSGSFLSFHLFVEVSDEVQDLWKKVGQGTFGRLEALCVGKSRELVQVVAQA